MPVVARLTATGDLQLAGDLIETLARGETTQSDFQQGTLSGVVATAAGDLELARNTGQLFYEWFDIQNWNDPNPLPDGAKFADNASELASMFDPASGAVFGGSGVHTGRIAWHNLGAFPDPRPSYLPEAYYAWRAYGFIYIPVDGTYYFGVDSDDASDVLIDGQVVASWYGPHGTAGTGGTPNFDAHYGSITLTSGWHRFEVRMQEWGGGDGVAVGWKKPGDAAWSIIPAEQFASSFKGTGTRTSPILDLSPVGIAAGSSISWTATTPAGTAVQVETSLDGGATWQAATNGGPIPGITPGMDLTGKTLLVRQTLTTQDTAQTPKLHELLVQVDPAPPAALTAAGNLRAAAFVEGAAATGMRSDGTVSAQGQFVEGVAF